MTIRAIAGTPGGRRRCLLVAAMAFGAARVLATPVEEPAPAQEFGDEIRVTVVEVPVRVLDEGRPVRGLRREQFELRVDGEPVELSGFEVIDFGDAPGDVEGAGTERIESGPRARRNFLLLFDFVFGDRNGLLRAIGDTRAFVAAHSAPTDWYAIAVDAGGGAPRLLVPFTDDRERIAAGLDVVAALFSRKKSQLARARSVLERHTPEPSRGNDLARLADELGPAAALVAGAPSGYLSAGEIEAIAATSDEGRFADGERRDPVLERIVHDDPSEVAAELAQSALAATARSQLEGLGRLLLLLSDLPGQKHLVFYSRGLDPTLLTASDSVERPALLGALQRLMAVCRSTGWAMQPVDLAGVPPPDQPGFAAEALFALADGTGGRLYENYNEFDEAAAQLLVETSVTYLLTFDGSNAKADGSRHEIEVRVQGAPRGARVIHRPAFDANRPPSERSELERRLERAAELLGEGERFDFDLGVEALVRPVGGGASRLTAFVDVAAESIRAAAGELGTIALEVGVWVLDPDRRALGATSRVVKLDLAKVGSALGRRGLRVANELILPSAAHRLRVVVHDPVSGRTALGSVGVEAERFELWPPLVAESDWLTIRAAPLPSLEAAPDPFRGGRVSLAPISGARLHADADVDLSLIVLDQGRVPPRVDLRLFDAKGTEVGGGTVGPVLPVEDSEGWSLYTARLALSRLPRGDYRIELATVDPATGERRLRADPFSVVDGGSSAGGSPVD